MRVLKQLLAFCVLALAMYCSFGTAGAQGYLQATGNPTFGVNIPVPNGYINVANGNLHLEFPVATLKQRGQLALDERIVYDSRIWEIVQYNNYYWWPLNVPNSWGGHGGGWRFVKGNEIGSLSYNLVSSSSTSCGGGGSPIGPPRPSPDDVGDGGSSYSSSSSMTWTDPSGTAHIFDAFYTSSTDCTGKSTQHVSSGYATDASGYQVVDDGNGNPVVKDPQGTEVYPQVIDRFGNYFSADMGDGADLVDDLGRTPVITTTNGNTIYYDVLAPEGPISNNGTRVRYIVTLEQLNLSTSFDQSGVTEYQDNGHPQGNYHPAITVVQSIQLPDGSSYQFQYDSYGMITVETLPTGAEMGYGWNNYKDSYQNVNRWLNSSTVDNNGTLYTPSVISQCASNGTGCQEQVNVHRPSGDETVYTLTLDNGAWDTNTTVYQGPAAAGQAKISSVNSYDFSHACNSLICSGAEYVTRAYETDTLPEVGLSTQTRSIYSQPQTAQISEFDQWDYYSAGSSPSSQPSRYVTYGYAGVDLNSEVHWDSNQNITYSASYNYTGTATATSGIVGHGTANAGGPYLTSTVLANSNPSMSYTVSTNTYDDTGGLLSTTDANGNPPTTYTYDSTDTFVIAVQRPDTVTSAQTFHHVSKASYDTSSGAILRTDDENSVASGQAFSVRYTYEPVAGRLQSITYPDGGSQTYAYPGSVETDVTVAQSAQTATAAPVSITTQSFVDGYGRPVQTTVGGVSTNTTYDGNGRPFSVSSPNTGTASSTDGLTYTYYDALDRPSRVVHPDGASASVSYTGNVALSTDELGNQKKEVFNAFGELIAVVEPDPGTGALALETDYQRDGLGNITCVEQHGGVAGTGCSAPPSSDASSPWRVRRFLYDHWSRLLAASIPEHTAPGVPAQQSCGLTGGNLWTDCYTYDLNGNETVAQDNRGVTRLLRYDALNRLIKKATSSPTASSSTDHYAYDAGINGVGYV